MGFLFYVWLVCYGCYLYVFLYKIGWYIEVSGEIIFLYEILGGMYYIFGIFGGIVCGI